MQIGNQVLFVNVVWALLNLAPLLPLDGGNVMASALDWMLPGLSGVDLAKRLRRDEHTARLPLIMLTARGEESDKLKSFESGVDDYIVKPFSPRELIARVKALLRRSGVRPAW